MMLKPDSVAAFAVRLRKLIGEIETPDAHTMVIHTNRGMTHRLSHALWHPDSRLCTIDQL